YFATMAAACRSNSRKSSSASRRTVIVASRIMAGCTVPWRSPRARCAPPSETAEPGYPALASAGAMIHVHVVLFSDAHGAAAGGRSRARQRPAAAHDRDRRAAEARPFGHVPPPRRVMPVTPETGAIRKERTMLDQQARMRNPVMVLPDAVDGIRAIQGAIEQGG